MKVSFLFIIISCTFCLPSAVAQQDIQLVKNFITEKTGCPVCFPIVSEKGKAASLYYDTADFKGVIRAIGDSKTDIAKVIGIEPGVFASNPANDYIQSILEHPQCNFKKGRLKIEYHFNDKNLQ